MEMSKIELINANSTNCQFCTTILDLLRQQAPSEIGDHDTGAKATVYVPETGLGSVTVNLRWPGLDKRIGDVAEWRELEMQLLVTEKCTYAS